MKFSRVRDFFFFKDMFELLLSFLWSKIQNAVNLHGSLLQLTLLLQCFYRWILCILFHVTKMKHFVIGRQATVPQFIWREKTNINVNMTSAGLRCDELIHVVPVHLTLSSPAADLPEHGSLTQPVKSLLADQLQQLWLQVLFEFAIK